MNFSTNNVTKHDKSVHNFLRMKLLLYNEEKVNKELVVAEISGNRTE